MQYILLYVRDNNLYQKIRTYIHKTLNDNLYEQKNLSKWDHLCEQDNNLCKQDENDKRWYKMILCG